MSLVFFTLSHLLAIPQSKSALEKLAKSALLTQCFDMSPSNNSFLQKFCACTRVSVAKNTALLFPTFCLLVVLAKTSRGGTDSSSETQGWSIGREQV